MTKGKRANEGYGAGGRTGSGDGGAASGGANESHACPANAPHLRKAEVSRLDPLYMTPAACSVCIRVNQFKRKSRKLQVQHPKQCIAKRPFIFTC